MSDTKNPTPKPVWDKQIATTAAAINHTLTMGGVIIKSPKKTGFD